MSHASTQTTTSTPVRWGGGAGEWMFSDAYKMKLLQVEHDDRIKGDFDKGLFKGPEGKQSRVEEK